MTGSKELVCPHTHTHTILDLCGFPGQRQGSSPRVSVTYCQPVQNVFRQYTSSHWAVYTQHHRKHTHTYKFQWIDICTLWATVSLPSDHVWMVSLPGTPSQSCTVLYSTVITHLFNCNLTHICLPECSPSQNSSRAIYTATAAPQMDLTCTCFIYIMCYIPSKTPCSTITEKSHVICHLKKRCTITISINSY